MGRNREKEEEELLYKNDDDDDEGVKKNEKCLGKVIVEDRKLLRIIVFYHIPKMCIRREKVRE